MMLEALLVVDEQPSNSIHHIDTAMISTSSFGSLSSPTWATRPAGIDDDSWKRLQTSLYPERITVTLCDCELDLLDLQVEYSNQFDAEDTPSFDALRTTSGIIPYCRSRHNRIDSCLSSHHRQRRAATQESEAVG